MKRMGIVSLFIILIFSFNVMAQSTLPEGIDESQVQQKNEQISQEALETLTSNDTLVELENAKKLILDEDETDLDIIKSIPKDAWDMITAPAGWTKKQWFIASGVVTMTTLMMVGDNAVRDFFQNNKSEFTEGVAYVAEKGGSQSWIGLGATYLIGTMLKDKKLKKASLLAFSSLIISGVLVQGLKHMFGRQRPYAATDQWNFTGPKLSNEYHSFPSGHTASAFSIAAAISTVYDSKLVKILAYTAAALTGLSRIHDNKHWMSDVFMGAVLGTATGIFVAKQHMKFAGNKTFSLSPSVINVGGQSAYGASLTIQLGNGKKRRRKKRP